MKGVLSEKLIINLKELTQTNLLFVQKKCVHLGENQMVWRPSSTSWNIQEVLSHLNSYSAYYNQLILEKLNKKKHKASKEQFVSSPLGRSAWRSMKLGRANNIKRKFQATKNYNPVTNPGVLDNNSIENFIHSQKDLLTLLDKAKSVNLKKIKIPMSISKIIRLRLGDALMFVVYHNERHIQQIKNILNHSNFPKKK